jgi:hypothetical protein
VFLYIVVITYVMSTSAWVEMRVVFVSCGARFITVFAVDVGNALHVGNGKIN